MSKESSSSSGVGVFGLLGVAFVVLKLCGVIDWSWWWVTAPFWGGLALVIAVMLVIFLVWMPIQAFVEHRKKLRNEYWKKAEILEEKQEVPSMRKSKFMSRLDDAMQASEKAREQDRKNGKL
jgi:phosphotransferase system  glucose/maltose/N-acetylglucosamine-specific IIC component